MQNQLPPPLGGPAPDEIPLSRAPLVHVVLQARFSSVLKIDTREGIIPFQENIRAAYPLLEQAQVRQYRIAVGADMPSVQPTDSNLWRFSDANRNWLLSLAADAVTLESRRYDGRTDFLERWLKVLSQVEACFAPGLAVRLGVRYINRISGSSLAGLGDWVLPSLIGVAQPELREYVTEAVSQASLRVAEGALFLRWGIVPAGASVDPALPSLNDPSWILDIDVSSTEQRSFSAPDLTDGFQALASRAYTVFRYALTDAGLDHFGATP